MCVMLESIFSHGIIEAYRRLITAGKQSTAKVLIGSTVQPIADVNIGYEKFIVGSSTAGNSTYTVTVPSGKYWKIIRGSVKLVTDATVANRYPYLTVTPSDSGAHSIYGCTKVTAITASLTRYAYLNKAGLDDTAADSVNIKEIVFKPGDAILFGVTSGVAGDAFTVELDIREFEMVI